MPADDWSLTDDELGLVAQRGTSADKLAFAVLLKHQDLNGVFPNSLHEIHEIHTAAVDQVAGQLQVLPEWFHRRSWDQATLDHYRHEIRAACKVPVSEEQLRHRRTMNRRTLAATALGVVLLVVGGGLLYFALETDPTSAYHVGFDDSDESCDSSGTVYFAVSDGALLACTTSPAHTRFGSPAPRPWTEAEVKALSAYASQIGEDGISEKDQQDLQDSADSVAVQHGYRPDETTPLYPLAFICVGAGALVLFARTILDL